eukprot:s4238_g8.t1
MLSFLIRRAAVNPGLYQMCRSPESKENHEEKGEENGEKHALLQPVQPVQPSHTPEPAVTQPEETQERRGIANFLRWGRAGFSRGPGTGRGKAGSCTATGGDRYWVPLDISTYLVSRVKSSAWCLRNGVTVALVALHEILGPMHIGSAGHFTGEATAVARCDCKRCCFHPKGRCSNGYECRFCHFEHDKSKRIKKPITPTGQGMGSFGTVWEAEQTGGGPALALKEILCRCDADLNNAQFEGRLLESFKGKETSGHSLMIAYCIDCKESKSMPAKEPGKMDSASILPVLVGSDTSRLSDGLCRVRLAMTRLPGQPLDDFLRRRVRQEEQLRDQRYAANRIESMNEAFHFAWQLLDQLAPAFEDIAALAYHRDVNAHNILIDLANGPNPKYGLVDFGLAVDVQSWHGDVQEPALGLTRMGQDGATSWHHLDVGGDCRYWPVSAWVQFLFGWTELEHNPTLRSEYRTRLDMHSLGLTALQVLVEMMPPDLSLPPGHSAGRLFAELQSLKSGWERYWAMVTPLHSQLMETFRNGGPWDAGRSLPSNSGQAGLLTALLLLIGCGDRHEVSGPQMWRQVRAALSFAGPPWGSVVRSEDKP